MAHQRIIKRNRLGENNISKKYIHSLNNYYNRLYIQNNDFNVHIIDANRNIESVYEDVKKIILKYQH